MALKFLLHFFRMYTGVKLAVGLIFARQIILRIIFTLYSQIEFARNIAKNKQHPYSQTRVRLIHSLIICHKWKNKEISKRPLLHQKALTQGVINLNSSDKITSTYRAYME